MCVLAAEAGDAKTVVRNWYEHNPRADVYSDIEQDLIEIIAQATAASLPEELFLEILDEAATKKISSQALLDTLVIRLKEFLAIQVILKEVHPCLEKKMSYNEYISPAVLKKYSLLLRQGISERILKEMLAETCAREKNYEYAMNVLRTLSTIPSRDELSEEELVTLGKAILGSTLSPTSYTALSSLYIKGKLKNLSTRDITAIFISVLKEGKGLVRIEQELNRRSGR